MKNKRTRYSTFDPSVMTPEELENFIRVAFLKFVTQTSKTVEMVSADVADICYYEICFLNISNEREVLDRLHKLQNELTASLRVKGM